MSRFLQWRKAFPGLLWSICQRESRLEVFTRWRDAGFDAQQFLKNAAFRKQAVIEQDYPLLVEFWDMIHAGRPAAAIFRLKYENVRNPLILQGWPESRDVYSGFLKEAFLPGGYTSACYDAQLQMRVGDADYPVFTVDLKKQKLGDANSAARVLFGGEEQAERALCWTMWCPNPCGKIFLWRRRRRRRMTRGRENCCWAMANAACFPRMCALRHGENRAIKWFGPRL